MKSGGHEMMEEIQLNSWDLLICVGDFPPCRCKWYQWNIRRGAMLVFRRAHVDVKTYISDFDVKNTHFRFRLKHTHTHTFQIATQSIANDRRFFCHSHVVIRIICPTLGMMYFLTLCWRSSFEFPPRING